VAETARPNPGRQLLRAPEPPAAQATGRQLAALRTPYSSRAREGWTRFGSPSIFGYCGG
jgi:hypothetical protein